MEFCDKLFFVSLSVFAISALPTPYCFILSLITHTSILLLTDETYHHKGFKKYSYSSRNSSDVNALIQIVVVSMWLVVNAPDVGSLSLVSHEDEVIANCLTYMLGYLIVDLGVVVFHLFSYSFVLHHILIASSIVMSLAHGRCLLSLFLFMLEEISTPFLNSTWRTIKMKKDHRKISAVFGLVFVLSRFVYGSFVTRAVTRQILESNNVVDWINLVLVLYPSRLLNIVWLVKIIGMA